MPLNGAVEPSGAVPEFSMSGNDEKTQSATTTENNSIPMRYLDVAFDERRRRVGAMRDEVT